MDDLIEWCEKQIKFLEETAGVYDNQADMEWFAEIVKALRELQSLRADISAIADICRDYDNPAVSIEYIRQIAEAGHAASEIDD